MHDDTLPFPEQPRRKRPDATPADRLELLERLRQRRRLLVDSFAVSLPPDDEPLGISSWVGTTWCWAVATP